MSDPTIGELLKDQTKESIFDDLIQACVDEGLSTSAWQPGEPIRAVISIIARVLATIWIYIATPAMRGAFLDYAEGSWLTLLAWTNFNVKRRGKEFATANVVLENRSGAFSGVIAIGQVRIKSASGKTFTNISTDSVLAWIGSGAYPTVTLAFTADEAGTESDTLAANIVVTPIAAPTGIYVKKAPNFRGSDGELDDALRARCRASVAVLSPAGPALAYEFIALSTNRPDGSPVPVNRVKLVSLGGCQMDVYLAGPSGTVTGDMGTAGSDVFLVYANLLRYVVPAGFVCNVYGADEQNETVTIDLILSQAAGLDEAETIAAVGDEIAAYIASLPIGGLRDAPIVNSTDDGVLFKTEIEAEASEAVRRVYAASPDPLTGLARLAAGAKKGVVKATASGSDIVVDYRSIVKLTATVNATTVLQ